MDDEQLRDAFRDGDGRPDDAFAAALEDRLRTAAAHGTVAVELADEAETNAARRRRAGGWRAVVAIGAAAALVGAVVVVRGGTHTAKPTIADIGRATVGTAHIESTVHETLTSGGATDGNGSFDTTSSGDVDFTHRAARLTTHVKIPDPVMLGSASAGSSITADGLDMTSLEVGGRLYMSLTGPMFGVQSLPVALRGKHWIRVDLATGGGDTSCSSSATTSTLPAPGGAGGGSTALAPPSVATCTRASGPSSGFLALASMMGMGLGGNSPDPTQILDALRKAGATLTLLGDGTVRGAPVHRYAVTLHGPAAAAKPTIEVDVDSQNRLRRSIVSFTLANMIAASAAQLPKDQLPTDGPSGTVRMQTDLYDFGAPVDIQAPAPSDVVSMADYEKAMSASSSNIAAPQVPTKLTTPWQRIGESSDGAWVVYQGTANDWTCYAVAGTAVDTTSSPFGSGVLIGMPTQLDGKQATCVHGSSVSTLLAHLTKGAETLVGVASAPATVTVQLAQGAPATVNVPNGGVFAWRAPSGTAATQLTIASKGQSPVACRPLASDFQIGNNTVTSGGSPSGSTWVWTCDGVGAIQSFGSSFGSGGSGVVGAPSTVPMPKNP